MSKISKARKKVGVGLIIFGLITALLGGYGSQKLSDSFKPLESTSGYMSNGQFITVDKGTIGGNLEAVSFYNNMKYIFIIAGIVFAIGGIWLYLSGKKLGSAPSIIRRGKIIALDGVIAAVEFDDGSRERLRYSPADVVLTIGDKGKIDIKENIIVSLEKD